MLRIIGTHFQCSGRHSSSPLPQRWFLSIQLFLLTPTPLCSVNKADSSVCTRVVRQGFKAAKSLPQASLSQLQGAAENKHIYEDITVTIYGVLQSVTYVACATQTKRHMHDYCVVINSHFILCCRHTGKKY